MSASGTLTHTYTYVADASHEQSDALTPTTHRRERRPDRNGDAMRGTKRCPPSGRKWAHTLRGRRKERERENEHEQTTPTCIVCCFYAMKTTTINAQKSSSVQRLPSFPLPSHFPTVCALSRVQRYMYRFTATSSAAGGRDDSRGGLARPMYGSV